MTLLSGHCSCHFVIRGREGIGCMPQEMHGSNMLLILMEKTYPGAPDNYSYNYDYPFYYTERGQVLPLCRKQQEARLFQTNSGP